MSVRVLLVDDQALIRAGFRMILEAEEDIEVVGECADGTQAVDSVRRLKPDVVLMDIRMPEMDGIEATRLIAGGDASPRVLMLTTFDLDEYVYDALQAGASGFCSRTRRPDSWPTASGRSPPATRCSRRP
jgi:DNA-binding NarL/FixJ family response regulator